jgi:hypothetical protein
MVDKPRPTPRRGYLYHKALSMAEEQEAKPGELRGAASGPAPTRFGGVSCRAAAALVRGKGPERFGVFPSENGSVGTGLDGGVIWPPPHSRGKRFASRKSTSVSTICLPCRRSAIDRGRPGKSARRQLLAPSITFWTHTAFPELRADRPSHRLGNNSRP